MLSYNWVPVIGICPLLPALHAGSVNIDIMPDYSNSCFKEWVHEVCGWDAFISHLVDFCMMVPVFVCFHVVQVFLLQFCSASSLFGCLTTVHYWWLNLLWIIFSQRIEVVFPTALERSAAPGILPGATSPLAGHLVFDSEASSVEAREESRFSCAASSASERGSGSLGASLLVWRWIDLHAHLCLPPWAVMWKHEKPRLIMVGFAVQLTPKSGLCSRPLSTCPRGPQH